MEIIIIIAVIFIIYKVITKHRSFTPSNSNSIQSDIPKQPIKKRSNPHRILICDDAAFMRMLLKDILTKDGYEVIAEAQDGLEAIERYYEFKPDLVFMDITMPKMDGIDATITIKEMDSHANIVVCSTLEQQEQVIEAIHSGAKDFIVKPFNVKTILKTMADIEPLLNDLHPNRAVKRIKPIYRDRAANIASERIATPPVETEQSQTPPEESNHDNLEKREVDKDFGKRNQKHGDFYFYVVNMTDTQLVNTINGQYKSIKGTWNVAPCMGEYGSIEFAAVLLLWRYAKANFDKNQEAYVSLQVTLGDMIGCSFFGMSAGEWSDNIDPILNAHADILTYDEFGDVYNYLKENFIDEIHSMEFNKGNKKGEVYSQLYAQFMEVYNSMGGYPETFNFYTSKGLKLRNDIQFLDESSTASLLLQKWEWGNKDFMKAVLAFQLSQKWESGFRDFIEDANITMPPTLTDKFYISSYRCPTCGRHMYKTVFPIGAESPIKVDNEVVLMKRIFTCPTCQTFYTPLSGHKLSYGQCYILQSQTQYDLLLKIFDAQATTDGRPDA